MLNATVALRMVPTVSLPVGMFGGNLLLLMCGGLVGGIYLLLGYDFARGNGLDSKHGYGDEEQVDDVRY